MRGRRTTDFDTPAAPTVGEIVRSAFAIGSGASDHIPALDGLRGVAVLFVVVSHLSNQGADVIPGLSLSGVGKVGVWLFFVLSSFLLTSQMLQRSDSALRESRTWLDYTTRRVLRIFPLYAVVLTTCLYSRAPYSPRLTAEEVVAHLTLRAGAHIFWSIPVEFKFYVVLPLLVLTYVFLLRRSVVAMAAAVTTVIALLEMFPPVFQTISLTPYLPIFLLGSLAAVVQREIELRPALMTKGMRAACEMAAVAIFTVIVTLTPSLWSAITGRRVPSGYFHRHFLLFGVLWASFLLCQLNGRGLARRLLSSAPLRFIGIVSFSVYLWHPPVIAFVLGDATRHRSIQATLALCLALAAAAFSYLLIERPFLRLGSALRRDPRPDRSR